MIRWREGGDVNGFVGESVFSTTPTLTGHPFFIRRGIVIQLATKLLHDWQYTAGGLTPPLRADGKLLPKKALIKKNG